MYVLCNGASGYPRGLSRSPNRCVSVLRYEAAVKESIQRYKFDAREYYCRYYGELLAASFSAKYDGHVDLVSWVPISKQRLAKRGFNQSQRLVLEMVKHCKVPPSIPW